MEILSQGAPENAAWQMIEALYTDDFITDIATRFQIPIGPNKLAQKLREIGQPCIAAHRAEKSDLSPLRADYVGRRNTITLFKCEVLCWGEDDMAGLMADAARGSGASLPTTDFPDLDNHQRRRGDAYYHELLRLVELAEKGMELMAKRLTSGGGRPINYGLESLTRRAANFWCDTLQRKFTLDYHKGSGLTEAFCFVQALLKPIAAISDAQIVTAMRAEIKVRNAARRSSGQAARKARDIPSVGDVRARCG